jgi:hypothetical protein
LQLFPFALNKEEKKERHLHLIAIPALPSGPRTILHFLRHPAPLLKRKTVYQTTITQYHTAEKKRVKPTMQIQKELGCIELQLPELLQQSSYQPLTITVIA